MITEAGGFSFRTQHFSSVARSYYNQNWLRRLDQRPPKLLDDGVLGGRGFMVGIDSTRSQRCNKRHRAQDANNEMMPACRRLVFSGVVPLNNGFWPRFGRIRPPQQELRHVGTERQIDLHP